MDLGTPDVDATLAALAHPVRRSILEWLVPGSASAGDLADSACAAFGISRTRASQHLGVLARAGLVSISVDGPWRWYALSDGSADDLDAWLRRLRLSACRAPRRSI
ncbi:ArsR/SmtB family transcription factor [Demequina maris]|uniref:ArsR/SmtB family transcription factor n=1 Tax=Demequina maris TaxID=1638982 RepID=UPI00078376DF|nr:metalloregulator ArsR/SmtB family transcription factor [Demequina maris]